MSTATETDKPATAPPPAAADPPHPDCGCGSPLDLSQPDGSRPDRLLGVCPGCGGWYQVDRPTGALTSVPDPM